MIDLTPIAKNIQKRMFEKMKILGRADVSANTPREINGLTHNNLTMKTPFLRMCSELENPIILMGGEVNSDGTLKGGYNQIYGSGNKPMPGITAINAEFKGGLRALRQGTVNWTVWSFDELERLTPHFLSLGKTVLLEWGWVYGSRSLNNLPTFIDKNGIKRSAYNDYINTVIQANGDFDMMIGIVKNFEYTSRSDGGFDCTTTLISMGDSAIKAVQPSSQSAKKTVTVLVDMKNNTEVKNALGGGQVQVLDFSTSLKTFISNIDFYLGEKLYRKLAEKPKDKPTFRQIKQFLQLNQMRQYHFIPDEFIVETVPPSIGYEINNAWVRWGWFEDNILSKFTTVLDSKNNVKTQFRSVNNLKNEEGLETEILLESTRIRNHPKLNTNNTSKYILPGQFNVQKKEKVSGINLDGDDNVVIALAEIVNNRDNFSEFDATPDDFETLVEYHEVDATREVEVTRTKKRFGFFGPEITEKYTKKEKYKKKEPRDVEKRIQKTGDQGYLRNMLISTRAIKNAFGVDTMGNFSVESITIEEALNDLFRILNEDIAYWNFKISGDQTHPERTRIIDANITKPLPPPKTPISSTKNNYATTRSVFDGKEVDKHGVFYFPVWRNDSFVKSQNLSCSVPNSMAITIMYGAGANPLTTAGDVPPETTGTEELVMSKMDADTPETKALETRIALYNSEYQKYGGNDDGQLTKDGSDDNILQWFIRNKSIIKDVRQKEQDKTDLKIAESIRLENQSEIDDIIDATQPIPSLEDLLKVEGGPEAFRNIKNYHNTNELFLTKNNEISDRTTRAIDRAKVDKKQFSKSLLDFYNQKYELKEEDGFTFHKLKPVWLDSMDYDISKKYKVKGTTQLGDGNQPVLLPLNIELEIDGIGGILPGNSFHSSYVPQKYQDLALFQLFDVNHKVDANGWSVNINGKMRSTLDRVQYTELAEELEEIPKLDIIDRFNAAKSANDVRIIRDSVNILLADKFTQGENTNEKLNFLLTDGSVSNAQKEYIKTLIGK